MKRKILWFISGLFCGILLIFCVAAGTGRVPMFNYFLQNNLDGNNQSIVNLNGLSASGNIITTPGQTGPSNVVTQIDLSNNTLPSNNFLQSTNPAFVGAMTMFSVGGPIITNSVGSPESAITAPVGSLCINTSGGSGTTLYVKESGTGNTGWVGK